MHEAAHPVLLDGFLAYFFKERRERFEFHEWMTTCNKKLQFWLESDNKAAYGKYIKGNFKTSITAASLAHCASGIESFDSMQKKISLQS